MKRVALITFVVFMVEALVHYNLGKEDAKYTGKKGEPRMISPYLPPVNSLVKLAILVGVFSIINKNLIKTLNR